MTVTPLVSFGEPHDLHYDFPSAMSTFVYNFGDIYLSTLRIPGIDGGFDPYGKSQGPSSPGTIKVTFYLVARDRLEMTKLRDEVNQMIWWGRRRLHMQPSDPQLPPRWCWAKVRSIDMPQDVDRFSEFMQEVSVTWEASDSRWYSDATEGIYRWGTGYVWGGGSELSATWGSTAGHHSISGLETEITVHNYGNAPAFPRFVVHTNSTQVVTGLRIARIAHSQEEDYVDYASLIQSDQYLTIDAKSMHLRLTGSDDYADHFSVLHVPWFKLLPGSNKIRVTMDEVTDAADLKIGYYHTWI